jgi:putative membrane protein
MNNLPAYIPYCGTAPLPTEIWARWNLDLALLGLLAALCAWHAVHFRVFARSSSRLRQTAFVSGWFVLIASLVSPLCALSVSLFSARVTQHMLIAAIAAPLLALASMRPHRSPRTADNPFHAAGLFAVALWAWHWPQLYSATFASDTVYWLMHATITGTGVYLWTTLLSTSSGSNALARVGAGFLTLMQMGLLGALITFASGVLYAPHLLTTQSWGLTALEDQQLGGLIMWIPTSAVFLIAALLTLYSVLKEGSEQQVGAA